MLRTPFDTLPDGIRQMLGSAWRLAQHPHRIRVEATSPQALPWRGVRPFPSAQRYRCTMVYKQVKCPFFDEPSGMLIPIHDQSTAGTDMGADTERFGHSFRTAAPITEQATTVLTGELRRHGQTGNGLHGGIVLYPPQEASPRGIVDGLRQMVILHQSADLQVFKGKEARLT